MSEKLVPSFVVPDAGWGTGWEAGCNTVPFSMCGLHSDENQLVLCLRINYESDYGIKSHENEDYVTDYVSKSLDSNAMMPLVHQQIDQMVGEIMKEHQVKVTEYSISFGSEVFVAVYITDGIPLVRVFCQEKDAEEWRKTIATENWRNKFTDNPPVEGLVDEYFNRVAETSTYKVFQCHIVI